MMQFFRRLVREQPLGTVGGIIVLLLLLFCGIFADVLAPYGMNEIHLIDRYAPPSWQYLLGADQLGRDILSRIIYGARISVVVGLSATSINLVVALLIGATSGFFGGKLDMVVQRFVDAWMAFPGLLILITVMSLVGQGQLQIILVLGIAGGISGSRIARSAVIRIKENVYVQAAQAIGVGTGSASPDYSPVGKNKHAARHLGDKPVAGQTGSAPARAGGKRLRASLTLGDDTLERTCREAMNSAGPGDALSLPLSRWAAGPLPADAAGAAVACVGALPLLCSRGMFLPSEVAG